MFVDCQKVAVPQPPLSHVIRIYTPTPHHALKLLIPPLMWTFPLYAAHSRQKGVLVFPECLLRLRIGSHQRGIRKQRSVIGREGRVLELDIADSQYLGDLPQTLLTLRVA